MRYRLHLLVVLTIVLITACTPQSPPINPPIVEDPVEKWAPFTSAPLLWVVDNHPNARPQDGVLAAEVIYEVPVEGGLTRLLLLTNDISTGIIGPIRSGRGYFALIAVEYGAAILHHGGSPSFLGAVEALGVTHFDLINTNSQPIWRDAGREAPHNLYSDLSQATQYVRESFAHSYGGRAWPQASLGTGNTTEVDLHYTGGYSVGYRYSNGLYARTTDGVAEQYQVQNIIVQQVSVRDGVEVSVDLLSRGTAYLFSQGQVHSGTWTKDSPTNATKFLDFNGQEWQVTPGKTIVHIVPILTSVQFR